jgi:2-amino-4-hydroxy-6-hydroxymethyldihydropteridine diphosphokinase
MEKHVCIIGIGSNINPEKNIAEALRILGQENEISKISGFIKTTPIGISDQPEFLNGAAKVLTDKRKDIFKKYLKEVEDQLKRDRTAQKYGPRSIDLDIVVWDGEIVDNDYYLRDFLKKAVDEIT